MEELRDKLIERASGDNVASHEVKELVEAACQLDVHIQRQADMKVLRERQEAKAININAPGMNSGQAQAFLGSVPHTKTKKEKKKK